MADQPQFEPSCVVAFASYNIHRGIGTDGRRDLDRIARVLADLDCDLVALQEVANRHAGKGAEVQADYLGAVLGLRVLRGPTLLELEGDYGNALLTRLPVAAIRRLDLSEPGREPRGALDVELKRGRCRLRVIATHLGLRPRERRRQARRLLEIVDRSASGPLLVLGDLNEWLPGSRPLRWLCRGLGSGPAIPTFPSGRPLLALDRVLVAPRRALLELRAVRGGEARRASDHLPLYGRVRWQPE